MKAAIRSIYDKISLAGSRHDEVISEIATVRRQIADLVPPPPDEPPLEQALQQWREFYADRHRQYAEILKEIGEHNDDYSRWYKAGGYGYEPKQSRNWIINETSIPDFRGTCLDIGSGDGYWSWILSEWFHVYGVDPVVGGIDLANAIKRRLPVQIQRRVDFFVGDALEITDKYDVVFCRAPSFFNYPIYRPISPEMFDYDRARLKEAWRANGEDEATIERKAASYPPAPKGPITSDKYAENWRKYLDQMLQITGKLFVFILSTKPQYYGLYMGDTYNHDPAEVERLFNEFGNGRVRMDSTNTYIVGELYR